MASQKIIKFNVGGSQYEVSQSLLDRFPSSMLAKVSSETWKEGQADNEPIFVDRNGERFQYVLDYMRDSRVELPLSVPRGQFVLDMEYYGLDYEDSNITLSVANPKDLFHSLGRQRDFFAAKASEIEARYEAVAAEKLACAVASEYFSQLIQEKPDERQRTGSYGHDNTHNTQKGIRFFLPTSIIVKYPSVHRHTVDDIQEHLMSVGLKANHMSYSDYRCSDEVSVNVQLI